MIIKMSTKATSLQEAKVKLTEKLDSLYDEKDIHLNFSEMIIEETEVEGEFLFNSTIHIISTVPVSQLESTPAVQAPVLSPVTEEAALQSRASSVFPDNPYLQRLYIKMDQTGQIPDPKSTRQG